MVMIFFSVSVFFFIKKKKKICCCFVEEIKNEIMKADRFVLENPHPFFMRYHAN